MTKLNRKVMASLSIVLSAALVFSACGNKTKDDPNNNTSTVANTPETIHKLKLMGKSAFAKFVKWEDRVNAGSWKLYEEQLKKRNIELEYELVVPEQYATVVQTRLAAAVNLPDIMNISPMDDMSALSLGTTGTLIDINAAITKYSDGTINAQYDKLYGFSKRLTTAPGDKRYWFANAIKGTKIVLDNGKTVSNIDVISNAIRKDWLDKLKLPVPKTVEEWKSALKAFRDNDMNGNGVKDEVITFDPYSYSFFTGIAQWFGLVPDVTAFDPATKKVTSPWYQPGVKEYFALMSGLAKEGIFDVSLVGATEEAVNQRIAENKISALRSYALAGGFEDLVKGVPNVEYAILPPLTAKSGITPLLLIDAIDLSFDKVAITKACKDVEGAIKLFDYVFSDEFNRVKNLGVENVDYLLDNEGKAVLIDQKITREEAYKKNQGSANAWLSNFYPRLEGHITTKPSTAKDYLEKLATDKLRAGAKRRLDLVEYSATITSPFSSTMYALPSKEELETTNKYMTSLKTYSEELSMNLILGNASMDKWDDYMKKLKDLGLDKMIEVNQARYSRYDNAK